jgi:hypothetical protein
MVNSAMRASDHDREATVTVLRDAYAAGRLDLRDLRTRAGAAYTARTQDNLHGLADRRPSVRPAGEAGRSGRPRLASPGGAGTRDEGQVPGADRAGGSRPAYGRGLSV